MELEATKCKGCLNSEIRTSGRPGNFRPGRGRWVSEEEYKRRLEICRSCNSLLAMTTCAHCGCLVQYSAALKDKRCPDPEKDRWLALSA